MCKRLFFLSAIVIIAGCNRGGNAVGPTTTISSAGLPQGWSRVQSDDGSVSIGLPPGWSETNMSQSALAAGAKQAFSGSKSGRDIEGDVGQAMQNRALKLMFYHALAPGSSFALNGNVNVNSVGNASFEQIADANKAQVTQLGASNVSASEKDMPAGHAEVIEFEMPINTKGGPLQLHDVVYIFVENGKQVALTFSIPPDEMSLKKEMGDMANTLEIK